ncbi:hypothetical protein, partial [Nocardia vaccinii]|uniref:hypothetical protein n=1 Tax=Nocardia vaccinii TaxID=1822 RepID=UPI001C3FAEB7
MAITERDALANFDRAENGRNRTGRGIAQQWIPGPYWKRAGAESAGNRPMQQSNHRSDKRSQR